ncbi:MAG TPA: AraC family transcriptional regulator [Polyangiaceae bacterium]|jgi:AraC-like DNA-binding protein
MKTFQTFFVRYPSLRPDDAARLAIVSVGHFVAGPDFELARSRGHTVEHLIYTIRGAALGDIAGKHSRATAGSLWLTRKDRGYGYGTDPGAGLWEGRWIEYDGAWVRSLWSATSLSEVTHVPGCFEAAPVVEDLFSRVKSGRAPELHDAAALLWRLFALAEGALAGVQMRSDTTRAAIGRAQRLIRERLNESLVLERLAEAAGLSPFHFSRLFHRHTGFTPAAYVRAVRVSKAQELLRSGELSVKQVGYAVGYPSPQHFSAVFKRSTGMSPRAFLKQHAP